MSLLIREWLRPERPLVEASLQEQRVLARVYVVATSAPHLAEAEPLIETTRLDVRRSNLEERASGTLGPMVGEQRAEQEPADPLAAPRRVHGQVRHVDLVGNHPQAQVADDGHRPSRPAGTLATGDPQARDPVSL